MSTWWEHGLQLSGGGARFVLTDVSDSAHGRTMLQGGELRIGHISSRYMPSVGIDRGALTNNALALLQPPTRVLAQAEIRRLDTSLHHLVRSNAELRDFDSNDPDCVQAIAENELTIQRQTRRRANLQAMLDKMEASAIEARTSTLTGDTFTSASVPAIAAATAVVVEVSSSTSTPPVRTPEVEDDGVFL